MAADDAEQDVATARTIASGVVREADPTQLGRPGSPGTPTEIASGDIPRTNVPGTEVRAIDPALAATITPDVQLSSPGRATSTLTAEHPGRYVRQAELGRGGMGRVIVVKDTHLGREVALKELLDQSVPGNDAMSIGSAARFLREARITGQLEHPGIVPVHELGQRADGTIYYTMKRIRGRSLASILKEKTTLQERLTLLAVFRNVCEAVAYAHSKGVVHRDLKPDNIMVGDFGDTLVVDWGLAKVRGEAEIATERVSGQSGRASSHDDLARTLDGHAIGTPAYMSPEQARGELGSIDERADVWGLGTILYEILAGHPPYVGTSALDVLAKVLDTPPPRVIEAAPDAPAELAAVVDRSLMRDASSRYPNAGEVAKEIGAYLDGRTVGAYEYSAYELGMRFVRKHRAASLAAVSVVLSILVTSIVVYRSFLDESRARAIAEAARDDAMEQRTSAEDSMHTAESAVADALLERAERALADGDATGAAVFAAGVLVRDAGAAMHVPPERHVRALSLYLEAEARARYVFERTIRGGHVRSCLSTDGRSMAVPTETAIRVVSLDDATERRVEIRATRVRALGPNGLAVIAGEASGVYDLTDGRRVVETPVPTSAQITDLGILVSAADGSVRVLAPDGGSELARWTSAYRGQVRAALSPAGDRVAVVSTDTPELEIWPWPVTASTTPERVALRALPFVAAFSPRGERLALLASDFVATIRFKPGEGPAHVREILTRSWPISLAWDHEAALALYEGGDRITIRDPSDGRVLDVVHFPAANGGRIDAAGERLVFFPSESRTTLGDATVLRAASGGARDAVAVSSIVRDVQLDLSRHRIVVASLTGLWSVPVGASGHLGAAVQLAPNPTGLVAHARVASDGAVVVSTLRGAVALLEPGADATTLLWPAVEDASATVGLRGMAISADGQTIYAGSPTERSVLVWSRHTHAADAPIPASSAAQALAASPDGRMLAIGGRDGSVQLVSLEDHATAHTVAGDDESISAMAFSPHGDRLAVADQTGRMRILDVHDGHVVLTAQPHRRYVNGVTWSGDGRWLVTSSDDPSVAVLSAADLTPARIIRTSTAPISAALGTDGSHLVFHDGRSVIQLDLRMGMTDTDPATLLTHAQDRAGVVLDGLTLAARD